MDSRVSGIYYQRQEVRGLEYKEITFETDQNIATITLNRPESLNLLTMEMMGEVIDAVKVAEADEGVRVVVLTGAGRAFSAGANLNVMAERIEARKRGEGHEIDRPYFGRKFVDQIPWVFRNLTKPIIAAINGPAAGGGLTLALGCDIRIASENAKFSAAFVRVGLIPELGSTYNWTRIVGIAKACELVFTGKAIGAKEAEAMGLVNQVVPHDALMSTTVEMARAIAETAPIAVSLAKRLLYQGLDSDLPTQLQAETFGMGYCYQTQDHEEGVRAFLSKRKPVFKGK